MSEPSFLKRRDASQSDAVEQLDRIQFELDELKGKLASSSNRPTEKGFASPTSTAVEALIRARRQREALFGKALFADPAWDILLELYSAGLAQRRVPMSELCNSAAVPHTTALRWVEKLDRLGWITRHADPLHGRRVFVELAPKGTATIERYFNEVGLEVPGV